MVCVRHHLVPRIEQLGVDAMPTDANPNRLDVAHEILPNCAPHLIIHTILHSNVSVTHDGV